jgi:hypothetical protein
VQTLQERTFCQLEIAHVQLDELRTRLRSHTQVLWLWVAIDPISKCIPVCMTFPPHDRVSDHLVATAFLL